MNYPTSFRLPLVCVCLVIFSCSAATALAQTIFGLKSRASSTTSQPPTRLFSFLSDGTGFTDIGSITLGGVEIDADALGISQINGSLRAFQVTANGSTLLAINSSNGVATSIGLQLAGRDIRGAVFDSTDTFYTIDSAANEILRIDPSSGLIVGAPIALTLGGSGFDVAETTDVAIRQDGVFYLVSGNSIYTLDPSTGVLTFAFGDSGQGLAGAAFSNIENSLFAYEVNGTDDLFRYATGSGFSRSTVLENIIPGYNAGRGDLAAARVPESGSSFVLLLAALGALAFFQVRSSGRV